LSAGRPSLGGDNGRRVMTIRVNALGVVATDFAATLAFYTRLGCAFDPEAKEPHDEADLGGFRLMIDTPELVAGETGPRHGIALAAQVGTPAEVDELYASLAADGHGVTEPFDAPWGMRYATVTDPDGTNVDLYAWLPGQEPPA
jgi:uncharacterized glyoxalase superfamily protein PhnB